VFCCASRTRRPARSRSPAGYYLGMRDRYLSGISTLHQTRHDSSLAFLSSAFSRCRRRISACASVAVPGRWPASISERCCHTSSVSEASPRSPPTCRQAAVSDLCSGWASASIRSARCRSSGAYLLGTVVPFLYKDRNSDQAYLPPQILDDFSHSLGCGSDRHQT